MIDLFKEKISLEFVKQYITFKKHSFEVNGRKIILISSEKLQNERKWK